MFVNQPFTDAVVIWRAIALFTQRVPVLIIILR